MLKIKKGDDVLIVVGKDKGKFGKVVKIINRVKKKCVVKKLILDNLNLVKKCIKSDPRSNKEGGIIAKESLIDYSNVVLLNKYKVNVGRVSFLLNNNVKCRFSKKLKEFIV